MSPASTVDISPREVPGGKAQGPPQMPWLLYSSLRGGEEGSQSSGTEEAKEEPVAAKTDIVALASLVEKAKAVEEGTGVALLEIGAKAFRALLVPDPRRKAVVVGTPGWSKAASAGWVKTGGSLRFYTHKITGATLLVLRDTNGLVQLSVRIDSIVCLEKRLILALSKDHKATRAAYVRFVAIADERLGLECFVLKVRAHELDVLFEQLKAMGAGVKGE